MCAGVWCNAKNTTRILIKENQTLVKLSHMRRTHRANEIVSHGGLTRATRMGYGNVCQTILRIHFKPFSASHVFAFLLYFPPPPPCPHPPPPTPPSAKKRTFHFACVSSQVQLSKHFALGVNAWNASYFTLKPNLCSPSSFLRAPPQPTPFCVNAKLRIIFMRIAITLFRK